MDIIRSASFGDLSRLNKRLFLNEKLLFFTGMVSKMKNGL